MLGAGSSGEHFVGALRRLDADAEIVVAERELAGGECSYYACLPTKTLLRSTEVLASARLAPGAAEAITGEIDVERVLWWRDQVTDGRDDSWHVGWLEDQRAELVRGDARVVERRRRSPSASATLEYDELVVATGSAPALPPLDGLEDVEYWTNREAIWASAVPRSLVVLGGGAVGVELAQFFRRVGSEVTLVEHNAHLLARLDRRCGRGSWPSASGRTGSASSSRRKPSASSRRREASRLTLDSGETLDAERLLVATGRRPNVHDLGLEELGVEVTKRGVTVDDRLRAADGVWAIGDAAGVGLLTHLGKYQARVAAANIAGRDVAAPTIARSRRRCSPIRRSRRSV